MTGARASAWRSLWAALPLVLAGCASQQHLFDGKSLAGWSPSGDASWAVVGGNIVAEGDGDGHLASDAVYGDFELRAEFWVDATTNSGIYIRCKDRSYIHPDTCYELNIWDEHPRPEARTGAIVFKVMPPLAQVQTVGRWNVYEVTARGSSLEVRVNGEVTARMEDADSTEGFIALQHYEQGTVMFRNITVEPL